MDGALLVVIPFKMQGMIPFKIQGVGYPNKLREIAYLWIVTCKDADCEMDQWSKRIDYNKYTKHYNKEHKQSWGNDKTISNVPNILVPSLMMNYWTYLHYVTHWTRTRTRMIHAMNGELFDKYPILRKFEESDYVCLQCIDSINDSVKVCTKYAKALKSEIYDKKANVNNDADQKEDGM
eukprot:557500_1